MIPELVARYRISPQTLEFSTEQIAAATSIFHGSNRPLQPLRLRTITPDPVA